ncbi:MAG: amidotransferase 1, exosortase A system-associated [Gammaproteobacteria bacterium]|nr:amidotransferase 1, exosortase A system-associated [Gammaproteobacteria bacterium]
MCGIAGIYNFREAAEVNADLLARITHALTHRGPDEAGFHRAPGMGFGHRRLSIIDIAAGQQPMFSDDKKVAMVFNGEIYNFKPLREELKGHGHVFHTRSDSEVLLRAWEHWGEDCVHHLRGMFAFAIADARRDLFFLARDRMGIKPMFYGFMPNGELVFASELKSLTMHPLFRREIDPLAVEDYFAYGYVPEPKTIYTAAFKLAPAHTLTIRRGMPLPQPRQYWDVPFELKSFRSEADAGEQLREQLRDAVSCHLESDVPLGAFLSGGVDSSAVVATMAGIVSEPVKTCSISFGDPKFNEAEYAQQVATRYHTDHFVRQVEADDFALIDKLAYLYDEPYADSSALPTYRVCELARSRVTVALSGDGGDENFAGYRRYRYHMLEEQLRAMLPLALRKPVFGTLGHVYPKADWAPKFLRAKSTFEALARDSVEGYFHSVSLMTNAQRRALFSPSLKNKLDGYNAVEVLRRHAGMAPTHHPLSLIQYLDMKTYLVGDILTKVDRASMAHSLEVRVPLLDHQFVEWASALPPDWKLRNGEGKYLFKKAMEDKLPNDLLYRKKMGFAIPVAAWFRGPLKEKLREQVLGGELMDSGLFNPEFLHHLVEHHQSGLKDYSAPLWSLMMFAGFLRQQSGSLELAA